MASPAATPSYPQAKVRFDSWETARAAAALLKANNIHGRAYSEGHGIKKQVIVVAYCPEAKLSELLATVDKQQQATEPTALDALRDYYDAQQQLRPLSERKKLASEVLHAGWRRIPGGL